MMLSMVVLLDCYCFCPVTVAAY